MLFGKGDFLEKRAISDSRVAFFQQKSFFQLINNNGPILPVFPYKVKEKSPFGDFLKPLLQLSDSISNRNS